MIVELEKITKIIGAATASLALLTGGYTLSDKVGWFKKPVLTWAPEYFQITSGPADGSFKVIVAREKHRDDCSVESFKLQVRDSNFIVHDAASSLTVFSGPATNKIDKFGYTITIPSNKTVSLGTATLLAHITYKCPEGATIVNYPDHNNLKFEITK